MVCWGSGLGLLGLGWFRRGLGKRMGWMTGGGGRDDDGDGMHGCDRVDGDGI